MPKRRVLTGDELIAEAVNSPKKVSEVFASRVKEIRTKRGWTQRALGERLADFGEVSLGQSAIARIETGRRQVSLDEAVAFAVALDVVPDILFLPVGPGEEVLSEVGDSWWLPLQVRLAPNLPATSDHAREWFRGRMPVPFGEESHYWEERSEEEGLGDIEWPDVRHLAKLVRLIGRAMLESDEDETRSLLGLLADEVAAQQECDPARTQTRQKTRGDKR